MYPTHLSASHDLSTGAVFCRSRSSRDHSITHTAERIRFLTTSSGGPSCHKGLWTGLQSVYARTATWKCLQLPTQSGFGLGSGFGEKVGPGSWTLSWDPPPHFEGTGCGAFFFGGGSSFVFIQQVDAIYFRFHTSKYRTCTMYESHGCFGPAPSFISS